MGFFFNGISTIAHLPDKKRRLEKRERKRRQSLDGDGSWRQLTGERRASDRRSEDNDESPIIKTPFLDEALDDKPETLKPTSDGVKQPSSESNDVSDSENRKPLSRQEQARLNSLKTMLDASNARYQQASRNRRPVFAAGLEVSVTQGEHAGKVGVVLDADYIENRALISLPDQESPHWIEFKSLGHTD